MMKTKQNNSLILVACMLLCLLIPNKSWAYDCMVDGMYFYLYNETKTAEVASADTGEESIYSGDVIIPESIFYEGQTYSVTGIGLLAFSSPFSSYRLTSVTIPNSVTTINLGAFKNCSGLTSVTLPNTVTALGDGAFRGCINLKTVIIGSGLNQIHSVDASPFGGCASLVSIIVDPNNKTYDSRDNCIAIIETSTNTLIAGCDNTIIPNSVTSIGRAAFYGCKSLTSVTIPNSVTSIGGYAFENCTGLASVSIPNSVTSIGGSAFSGCTGLTSVEIPNSVTSIGSCTFSGCTGLASVTIPNSVTSIGDRAFSGTPWYDNQPDGLIYINNVAYAYKGEMPEGTEINLKSGTVSVSDYAFSGCTGLTSVTIPNSVTSIGQSAFSGCTGLTSVTISDSVTTIEDYTFSGCTGLTSVTIPNSVTSIGQSAFSGCTGLTSVTISGSVTTIEDYTFSGCTGLTSITIPNSVTSIGNKAFSGCTGLTSVEIPNSVTSIGGSAFSGCTGLTSVDIPNSLKSINEWAFFGCTGLTSLSIPNGVLGIARHAFGKCTGLISLIIPRSVNGIGEMAFRECENLKSITVKNEIPINLLSRGQFHGVDKSTCILYVPKGSKPAYENDYDWTVFEHIVEVEFDTDISTLDNAIYVEQTEGRIGRTKDISVKMKNDFDVRGFQFSMELPEGTTINDLTLNQDRMPAGITMNKVFCTENIDGNKINVVCALNDGLKTFTGNDGAIATVNVSFAEDMEEGTYPIYLTDASISDASAEHQLELSDIKASLILEDYVLGDTNGDGKVLVGDVIAILNYIVGFPSDNFNAKAADLNGDGKVLVGDVIAVLNIIVNQ